ncbi:sugar phosphate isomerase/epimerase family protein [Cohnella boryungensis]|uniref:Sugar phosphate isomerase/epimerase family protein n=1 Tax=Cohnella boryungensis TaxID=768479 RepID=A0ABV8SBF4_9BACL
MVRKAVQQFQIRSVVGTEQQAIDALKAVKEAGYDGIELCGFLVRPLPQAAIAIAKAAGFELESSADLDWKTMIKQSGLEVVGLHEDLDMIFALTANVVADAKAYGTENIIVSGLRSFDFSDKQAVVDLAERLNQAGKMLVKEGLRLLYHNHNCELRKVDAEKTAFQVLIEQTDPKYVNFEFDSYWPTEAGYDPLALMNSLGSRMKLYHINDRGFRVTGPTASIIESGSMELGYGNMNLKALVSTAKSCGVQAVILETHTNWVEDSPIKSLQLSAAFMNEYV